MVLLMVVLLAAGCASYQGRKAFDDAELLAAEEKFDQSVGKYLEAMQLDPGNKTYKLKLLAVRTRAAASHIGQARVLAGKGDLEEALGHYRMAREFDPGLDLINREAEVLVKQIEARKLAQQAATAYGDRRFPEARGLVDQALQLDPDNADAAALAEQLQTEKKSIVMDDVVLDISSAEPITLRFKNARTREVFSILNELSGINFILDEDVRDQPISVLLEKASFTQAMELILQMNGLSKKVLNGKTIIIYPQTREKEKQYGDQIIQTFYLSHIDAKKAVNLLRTMLQLRKIFVHEERNALVIRAKPEVIRLAEQILSAADRANSEVLFALELVSVSDTDNLLFGPKLNPSSMGVGFSADGTNIVSGTLGTVTDGLVQSLNGLQTFYTVPSATFDLKKTFKDTEILASPKIRVRNRAKAKVHIGTREPVITTTTTDTSTSSNIQYVDVGVKVDVEPIIQLNNTVETKLRLEVSQVIGREAVDGVTALTISTTNAETVLTLEDGVQTVLGGLFEEVDDTTRTTIPILGDIPLIGSLFTNFVDANKKREILLSITPYIVRQVEVPPADIATIWSGGEDNLKVGPNFGSFAEPMASELETVVPIAAPSLKRQAPEMMRATAAETFSTEAVTRSDAT
jgi:general secretion pathway protein D